jgi:hypothetical protein
MSCAKAISTPQTLAYLSTTTGDALIDATAHPLIARIVAFLTGIGLHVEQATVPDDTFLPGIQIDSGRLLYDETRLRYPGDLLHEAGHLAVMLPNQRERAGANVTDAPADEMMAIGWSYAAALHIGLDPAVVFHAAGYRGGADSLLDNFRAGRYLGVPMLQWVGLCYDEKNAAAAGVPAYPHMVRWLRADPE